MARRMFTEKITRSDAFLDMPTSTQALYFHLMSEADDDGFVGSPKMVMRIVGATNDEIVNLVNKKFIIPFDGGICVIKHWRMHNQVRKDRYEETKYKKEKLSLFIRSNGAYSQNSVNAIPVKSGYFSMEEIEKTILATSWQPVDALGKGRLGQDRIDIVPPITEETTSPLEELKTNTQKDMAWKNKESEEVEDEIQLDEDFETPKKENKKNSIWNEETKTEWLNNLITNENDFDVLIGSFFCEYSNLEFPNKVVANFERMKNLMASKYLVKNFTNEQIIKTLKYCKKEYPTYNWDLNTVKKTITNVTSKKHD